MSLLWDGYPGSVASCERELQTQAPRLKQLLAGLLACKHIPYLEFRHDHLPPQQQELVHAVEAVQAQQQQVQAERERAQAERAAAQAGREGCAQGGEEGGRAGQQVQRGHEWRARGEEEEEADADVDRAIDRLKGGIKKRWGWRRREQ